MDAISFLLSRNQRSPKLESAGLFALSVMAWLTFHFMGFIGSEYVWNKDHELLSFLVSSVWVISGFTAGCVIMLILFAVPLTIITKSNATLRSWIENRILDELAVTGLSNRRVVDQLLWYHIKGGLMVALPSLLFSLCAWPVFYELVAMGGWIWTSLFYALTACIFCLSTWRLAVGPSGILLMLVPVGALFGPSLSLAVINTNAYADSLHHPATWAVTLAYLFGMGRYLSIKALANRANFANINFKLGRKFSIKTAGGLPTSENPIIARQEMLGRGFSDTLLMVGLGVAGFTAATTAILDQTATPVYFLLLLVGLTAAWRAAGRLSQSLTQELEGSTLETIRTTPLGSERFLKGWMQIAAGPLTKEVAFFVLAAIPVALLAEGEFPFVSGHFFSCAVLALIAPHIGGLFGASIAGQCKPRQEISGQLTSAVVMLTFCAMPQMAVVMNEDYSWVSFIFTLGLCKFASWVLGAGAKKSLNRVFLPQK